MAPLGEYVHEGFWYLGIYWSPLFAETPTQSLHISFTYANLRKTSVNKNIPSP